MTYKDIDGWFDFENIYDRIFEEVPENGLFVEIGAYKGKSTAYMGLKLKENPKFNFCTVDTFLGTPNEHKQMNYYPQFCKNMKTLGLQDVILIKRGDSVQISQEFPQIVDAVFIDADHSYEAVKNDIKAWGMKLKPGGIIAGHDIDFPSVWKAVKESFINFEYIDRCWIARKENLNNRKYF